ncbi:MAG TPA: hypothetical protein ACFYEL_08005, partial [Candidatus Wunengus californicus]|uniref:hypothetical protein n=1 Tax=Candidatus Wunengus californicus TaxID=3367619 RepID=UPI0040299000
MSELNKRIKSLFYLRLSALICVPLQSLGNIILKISPNIQCDTTDFWLAYAISNEICRNLQNQDKINVNTK